MTSSTTPSNISSARIARRRQAKAIERRALIIDSLTSGRGVANTMNRSSGISSTSPMAALASSLVVSTRNSCRRQRRRSNRLNGVHLEDAHPHLWLTEDNLDVRFRDVIQCLLDQSHAVQEISVYNIITTFTERDIQALYDIIARMPKLQTFKLWASSPMAVPVVASILQQAPGLTSLGLGIVQISNLKDLSLLAKQVCEHPSLKKLTLENLVIENNKCEGGQKITLDLLLQAVAANPHLECLQISMRHATSSSRQENEQTDMMENDIMISEPETLLGLCQNLKELRLNGINLPSYHIQRLTQTLTHHAPATTLTTLGLRNYGCDEKELVTLYDTMVDMLQHNIHLEAIYLDPLPKKAAQQHQQDHHQAWKIESLLQWNKSGIRKTLFQDPNATKSDWVDALSEHGGNNLNALNYLLHASVPTLFSTASV